MIELVVRVVLSLAVVLGLLWLMTRISSRRLGGGRRSPLRVLGRQALGRNASVAVVEAGDRVLLVGVSEHGVNLLTELDPLALDLAPAEDDTEPGDAALPAGRSTPQGALPAAGSGPVAGSLLSTQTWRQAWAAATTRNGAGS